MGTPLSIRRRPLSGQSLRQSQPVPWSDGLGSSFLAGSAATTVTANATTHTPGAWQQLLAASATTEVAGLLVIYGTAGAASSTDTPMLLSIGTGASGSETAIISGIAISQWGGLSIAIPVRIPGSSRLSAQIQSGVASRTALISAALYSTPFADRLPTTAEVLGTSTSTSVGTAFSTTANAWTEITASTTKDYQALVLVPSFSNATGNAGNHRYELGIGGSGNEVPVTALSVSNNSNAAAIYSTIAGQVGGIYGGFVRAGSRISARCSLATNPERADVCVIGVPYV